MDFSPWIQSISHFIQILLQDIKNLYDQFGYIVVYCTEAIGNTVFASIIIPSGTFAVFGGYYARQGSLNIFGVIFFVWLGIMSGFTTDYALGRFLLSGPFHKFGNTWVGKKLQFTSHLEQSQTLLNKHGGKAIIISHGWGHFRSFLALSAGITKMKFKIFITYEFFASLLWSIIYCSIGYFIGIEQNELSTHLELFAFALFITLGILILAIQIANRFISKIIFSKTSQNTHDIVNTSAVPIKNNSDLSADSF